MNLEPQIVQEGGSMFSEEVKSLQLSTDQSWKFLTIHKFVFLIQKERTQAFAMILNNFFSRKH